MSEGDTQRIKFQDRMRAVSVGARLRRIGGSKVWIVLRAVRRDTSIEVSLGCGLRVKTVNVPVCITGPCLQDIWMEAVQ